MNRRQDGKSGPNRPRLVNPIKRSLLGALGAAFVMVGLGCSYGSLFPVEPNFVPPSTAERCMAVAIAGLGILLGGVGAWRLGRGLARVPR